MLRYLKNMFSVKYELNERAVESLLDCLGKSQDSTFASASVNELVESVITSKADFMAGNYKAFNLLFSPSGALQDTAYDNGWGEQFLKLANELVID